MDWRAPAWKIWLVAWINQRNASDLECRRSACAKGWQLILGAGLAGGYRSHIWECTTARGVGAVLKLTVTVEEAELEARALQRWLGTGATVELLDVDLENGALLLERLRPATPLPGGDEPGALEVVVDLLARLHSVGPQTGFPTLGELYPHLARHSVEDNRYEREARAEPARAAGALDLLDVAARAARDLWATSTAAILLHGDFLDKNVLRNADRYVAVDPIPRLGDPESEIGFFACDHPPVTGIFARAHAIAERLGADPDRARRWAAVWTVLLTASAWRPDQDQLDALVASSEFHETLEG
jgi:streptomycin 6-kinase